MNIIVCVKEIPDPEIPPSKFKLDEEARRVIPPEGIPPVMSPYDEQAVELALRLKDKTGGKITLLTVGPESVSRIIKHGLAMGADEGIILTDKSFENSNSFSIAYILSMAVQKVGDVDLILCGREAADWGEGVVGSVMAEILSLPLVTLAESIEVTDDKLHVKRVTLNGYQVFGVSKPAVVTVSNEVGQPRLPSGWGIISASQKSIPVWNAGDIDADGSRFGAGAARRKLVKIFSPERKRTCQIIEGETSVEASEKLVNKMIEAGLI
jgi:electron transfer flavoprotein beta subunit